MVVIFLDDDVELDRRSRHISENTRGLVVQSVNESSWDTLLGPFSSFISLSNLISCREFFFLSWVLVPWFSVFTDCGYNSSLLPSPGLDQKRGLRNMPHHSASKLKPLKAFNMHLNTLFKVQASMCCKGQSLGGSRKFRHKWRPDWSLICNYER